MRLFWPLSTGMSEIFEPESRQDWFEMLRDACDVACFAMVSPRCLPFVSKDTNRIFRRGCRTDSSCVSGGSECQSLLQTVIDLRPEGKLRPPLKVKDDVKLDSGTLQIRNEDTNVQLAFFEPGRTFRSWRQRGEKPHWELKDSARKPKYTVPICIMDRWHLSDRKNFATLKS